MASSSVEGNASDASLIVSNASQRQNARDAVHRPTETTKESVPLSVQDPASNANSTMVNSCA